MKTAVICVAKNEDLYMDEWLEYQFKLKFDDVYVIQNEWRYDGKFKKSPNVILKTKDEKYSIQNQLKWYNELLSELERRYDFVAIFDIDEFLYVKNGKSLHEFLNDHAGDPAIFVNWRIFGDNGLKDFQQNDFSVLKRFLRCGKTLHKNGKTIVNMRVGERHRMHSAHALSHNGNPYLKPCQTAEVFHYRNKTYVERKNKPHQMSKQDFDKFYKIYNQNDVFNSKACDFMYGAIPETSKIDKIAFDKYRSFLNRLKDKGCVVNQYCVEDPFVEKIQIGNFLCFLRDNGIQYVSNVLRYPPGAMNNHHWQTEWVWKNFIPKLFDDMRLEFDRKNYRLVDKKFKSFDFSYHEPLDFDGYRYFDLENGATKEINVPNDLIDPNYPNPYHQRFLGFHRNCVLEKRVKNKNKRCMINCDSMSIPVVPIVMREFDEVLVLDNRTDKKYVDAISEFNPTHYVALGLARDYVDIDKQTVDKINSELYFVIHNKIFEHNIQ